jgi:tRNA U34 5-methylaminomethyl-2-thiouridine-forming methyltransferase MnmC
MDSFSPHLILTKDGSHSLFAPRFNQHYHSLHGSLLESSHIYLGLGLHPLLSGPSTEPIRVFEMGLGTGLNALLTWQRAEEVPKAVHYVAVEAFPIPDDQSQQLNYEVLTGHPGLDRIHRTGWGKTLQLSPFFELTKYQITLQDYIHQGEGFDVIYYDAFSPHAQPELWTEEVFSKVASFTRPGGVLVTYCTKGDVKRALRGAGFKVKKHPGPWGKRDVLRATRL